MRKMLSKSETNLLNVGGKEINQYLVVNNSCLYHEFRNFIVDQRAWNLNTEISEWPTVKFSTTGDLKAVVQIRPDPEELLNDEELIHWRDRVAFFISNMNDLTADCLDIICAIWLDRTKSPEGAVVIRANDFLAYRAIKKRGEGGYQVNQKRDIEEQIRLLSNLWINVFEMTVTEEVKNKKGILKRQRVKKYSMRSRAIVLSSVVEEETDGKSNYFWRMRPGDVFLPFLLGAGKQLAFISKKVLQYHVKK